MTPQRPHQNTYSRRSSGPPNRAAVSSSCLAPDTTSRRPSRLLPRSAFGLALLLGLGACSFFEARSQVRGNLVDQDVLKELVPGTSTRADATALLGSPTSKAAFDDNTWIYIGEVTQKQIARTQEVLNQQVIVLTFNDGGVLQKVRRLNQDDSLPVDVASGATPSPGSEASVLQQLFGSIGRYNPLGSKLNDTQNSNTR